MVTSPRRVIRLVVQSVRYSAGSALIAGLAGQSEIDVIGHAGTMKGLYSLCSLYQPAVALVDVDTLTSATVEALHQLHHTYPGVELVVIYMEAAPEAVGQAVRADLAALLPVSAGVDAVLRLIRQRAHAVRPPPRRQMLTDRELAIVALMGAGRSVPEMAELLHLSPHTVENHKRSIYAKFGVGNQSHALSRAISLGLFDISSGIGAPGRSHAGRHNGGPAGPAGNGSTAVIGSSTGGAAYDGLAGGNDGRESGRTALTVVSGPSGACLDEVSQALLHRGVPYVLARVPDGLVTDHWAQWQRGQVVALLIDPADDDWELPERLAAPAVVVRSTEPDVALAVDAVLHGAYAMVSRTDIEQDLVPVLTLVSRGYRTLGAANVRLLANWMSTVIAQPATAPPELTSRERDILSSIANGHTVRQTARSLGIATKTVENTQARLFRKLGTHNRSETLIAAYRLGLLSQ
ncbi:MAG: response regulator transcription factor [Micromonosporaceae bacterium]|nr:response regulator transcription factor [Micromonosporaceae bacterium]